MGGGEQRRGWTWAVVLAVGIGGCTTTWGDLGGVDEGGTTDEVGDTGPGLGGSEEGILDGTDTGVMEACAGLEFDVGPSAPRLLTRAQYVNTIADLFGLGDGPWADRSAEPWMMTARSGPFDAMTDSGSVEAGYEQLAPLVAQALDPVVLLPCAPDTPDPEGCAEALVPSLGRAVWRRPLTPEETSSLLAHYDEQDLVEGTRAVVEALLASPEFYVLREQGSPSAEHPGLVVLDPYSLATRISYFVWNSTPDAALLDLAEMGALSDPTLRGQEVQRMWADPRARDSAGEMYTQWLDTRQLDALAKDDPEFDPALGDAMETELRLLAGDIVTGPGDHRLATLVQAPYTYVNDDLSALYGADVLSLDGPPGPQTFTRADLDPERRGGLLSLPGVMARHSFASQVGTSRRGQLILEQWLCTPLPPEPPDVVPFPSDDIGHYAQIQELLEEPVCAPCHVPIEAVQVAFDNYDELGRWQTEIDGVPVQSQAELNLGELQATFDGRAELVDEMMQMPQTQACVAEQYVQFALRRPVDPADACTLDILTTKLEQTDGDLADLMVTLATTDAFAHVRPQ